jgi:hypothetical protein
VSGDSGTRARGRVRSFVGSRSASQRIGAVAVLAVLVTAPFGGLEQHRGYEAELQLGHRYDLGPFYLTLDKVVTVPDLKPAIKPQKKGDRLLVIEITVTNHIDDEFPISSVVGAIGGDHTGAVPWPKDVEFAEENGTEPPTTPEPKVFNVADTSEMAGEAFNPGQTYQLAVVVEQAPGWDPADFSLTILGLVHRDEDPTTLSADGYWLQNRHVARGHVDVEVKP